LRISTNQQINQPTKQEINMTTFIYNASDIETAQPIGGLKVVKAASPKSIYRKELRVARSLARFIDTHPALANLWIGGWAAAATYIIFMYG
jgi:hypothetical protein